jgi:hypothetical protein
MHVNPRSSTALWAPDNSSLPALLPHGKLQFVTQCQEAATTHPSEPQTPDFAICWHQEAFLPTEHGGSALPTVPDRKRALTALPKNKNAIFHTEGRKAIIFHSAGDTRSPVLPRHTEPQCFSLHLPAEESLVSCPRAGIPAPPLSGNLQLHWC